MPNAQVKVFGERNTGTNAVKRLIEQNSQSTCLPGTAGEIDPTAGRSIERSLWLSRRQRERRIDLIFAGQGPKFAWKHCAARFEDVSAFDGLLVLFLVRHPASWLLSFSKNPYNAVVRPPSNLARFLDFDWQTVARERLEQRRYKPLDLLATKIASYLMLAEQLAERGISYRFLRFEDLVLAQQQCFADLKSDLFGPAGEFRPLSQSTKTRRKNLRAYQKYYASEQWRGELAGLETAINQRVDWNQMRRFGYQPI